MVKKGKIAHKQGKAKRVQEKYEVKRKGLKAATEELN